MKLFRSRASVLIALSAVLIAAAAGIKIYKSAAPRVPFALRPSPVHVYHSPALSLERIALKVFYAVPQDRAAQIYPGWHDLLPAMLDEAAKFHEVQFHGQSVFSYKIFPEPFILKQPAIFYDTENTNKGNPEALLRITAEIENRAVDFLKKDRGDFTAIAVIYEGVGASGTTGSMILSRAFLSDPQYADFASTLFYHEFGHTMGLPDQYDLETNQPFSADIMGGGRRRPLKYNYLDAALLAEMNAAAQ